MRLQLVMDAGKVLKDASVLLGKFPESKEAVEHLIFDVGQVIKKKDKSTVDQLLADLATAKDKFGAESEQSEDAAKQFVDDLKQVIADVL